jgi:hypothetical protein
MSHRHLLSPSSTASPAPRTSRSKGFPAPGRAAILTSRWSTIVAYITKDGLAVIEDVYFLTVRAAPPRRSLTDFPVAAAVIVHARTFLHPALPQPDAGRVYRCLTELPGRVPGCLVPLSDLDYELCGGRLWPLVGDRARILAGLTALAAPSGRCDCLELPLVTWDDDLLRGGPYSHKRLLEARDEDYTNLIVTAQGTRERAELLAGLARTLRDAAAGRAWWPGDGLVRPPRDPAVMPYQPYGTWVKDSRDSGDQGTREFSPHTDSVAGPPD